MRYRALFAIAWITRIIALLLIIALVLGSCIVAVIAAAGSGLAAETGGVPVDLAGVQHGVATAADVDERGLHARQYVLDLAQVHVADHG